MYKKKEYYQIIEEINKKIEECIEDITNPKNPFTLEDVVKEGKNARNDLSQFNQFKESFGIYVFLDKKKPVYIGKGGTGRRENSTHYLKDRIGQELRADGTLAKNITKIDDDVSKDDAIKRIKSFNLLILQKTEKIHGNEVKKEIKQMEALETFLIAIFNPAYNL